MSDITLTFEIPSDSEGYVTFECPFCESEFKLLTTEVQGDEASYDELFCPYCGLTDGADHFYTKETVAYAMQLAENAAIEQLNKVFGKMAKSVNRNKYIKMDFKPLKKGNVKPLQENDTTEEVFQCRACGCHEKVIYCAGASKVFCAYCGVDL